MINVSLVTFKTPVSEIVNAVTTCALSSAVKDITVIDNSPDDDLRVQLDGMKGINYRHNPSNPGYGAAHNIAIRRSIEESSQFHLVLNTDVIFDFEILEKMNDYMESNPQIGLLAPRMLYEDGSDQCVRKLLPTPINMFLRALIPKKYRYKLDSKYQLESFGYNRKLCVSYVSGAFMLLRVDALRAIGSFDEKFFMYPEDIDLSRRISETYKVEYNPRFVITHKYGNLTRKSIKMFAIHVFQMILYFNKWGWFYDKSRRVLNKKTLNQTF